MSAASEFRAAIEAGDVKALKRISRAQEPHLPQMTDAEAELVLHQTRTRSSTVPFKLRAWSHRWLVERGHDSGLPDHLRPNAEQVCPRVVATVGIGVRCRNPLLAPIAPLIRDAMQNAVLDADAHGRLTDSDFVKARMMEARERTQLELLGRMIGHG